MVRADFQAVMGAAASSHPPLFQLVEQLQIGKLPSKD